MPKNRVEELETEVAELQSTVRGLTEELVEAKERIRVLEAELDTDAPTRVPDRRSDGARSDATSADGASEAEPDDVAAATAEADKSGEYQETDEADDSGVDDIIVA